MAGCSFLQALLHDHVDLSRLQGAEASPIRFKNKQALTAFFYKKMATAFYDWNSIMNRQWSSPFVLHVVRFTFSV